MNSAPRREVLIERFGNLLLPLGGKYEYKGVRGKQGRSREQFQGYTPKKTHFTGLCDTPQEAAVALAKLRVELAAGFDPVADRKPRMPRKKRGYLFGMHHPSNPQPHFQPIFNLLLRYCFAPSLLCYCAEEDELLTLKTHKTESVFDAQLVLPLNRLSSPVVTPDHSLVQAGVEWPEHALQATTMRPLTAKQALVE